MVQMQNILLIAVTHMTCDFLYFTKCFSRSLETSPNVSFLNWFIRATSTTFEETAHLKKIIPNVIEIYRFR